jgi:hypothetical protein
MRAARPPDLCSDSRSVGPATLMTSTKRYPCSTHCPAAPHCPHHSAHCPHHSAQDTRGPHHGRRICSTLPRTTGPTSQRTYYTWPGLPRHLGYHDARDPHKSHVYHRHWVTPRPGTTPQPGITTAQVLQPGVLQPGTLHSTWDPWLPGTLGSTILAWVTCSAWPVPGAWLACVTSCAWDTWPGLGPTPAPGTHTCNTWVPRHGTWDHHVGPLVCWAFQRT